ncbi:MAG: B12-binding domain-containing radical SAM protein [Candidatus Riflebacteria bacterium]|nr:B12-binding domain-containing radical SAM protein [Candidatus Riflebacteria bacterium]
MKLLLVLPHGPIHRARAGSYARALRYAPLTLAALVALIPRELGFRVQVIDEGVDVWNPADHLDADLVALSCMTGTAGRAYAMADYFRRHGKPVIMGGVHPTLRPAEAKEHADCVVTGLAEESWPQALRDFVQGRLQPFYRMRPDFDLGSVKAPAPDRSIFDRRKYITVNSIEATRGCFHKCAFCAIARAWDNRYFTRPVADVVEEARRLEGPELCFLDPSLTCDREFALQLFRALMPLGKWWVGCATIDTALDAELLRAMAESGCRGLLVGFESVRQEGIQQVAKPFNKVAEYREAVRRFHGYGIGIQACFVFGLDTDRRDVFRRTAEFAYEAEIDVPQFSVLTPFPGTETWRQLESEGRIIERDWSLYDAEHVVFRPLHMTPDELQEGLIYAWRKSYSLRSIFKRLAGSRCLLPISIPANLGYHTYAAHLSKYSPDLMKREGEQW